MIISIRSRNFAKVCVLVLVINLIANFTFPIIGLNTKKTSLSLNEDNLSYYPFDEGGGTIVEDYGNGNRDGVVIGANWVQDGDYSALEFNGNDAVVIDPPPDLSSNELTISIFAKYYSFFDDWSHAIITQDTTEFPDRVFQLATNFGSIIWHRFGDVEISTPWQVNLYQWYHIIAVYRRGVHQLWIDGTQVGVAAGDFQFNNHLPINIGRLTEDVMYFEGLIDEVRIYNRGLERSEIADLFANGRNGPAQNNPSNNDNGIAEFNLDIEDLKWLRYSIFGLALLALSLIGINTATYMKKSRSFYQKDD